MTGARRVLSRVVAGAVLAVVALDAWGGESAAAPESEAEDQAIHAVLLAYADAWNKKDAKALGDLYAEDADFASIYGQTLHGRAMIAEKHGVLFAGAHKESQQSRNLNQVKIRYIKPDVAWVDSVSEITGVLRNDGSKTSIHRALSSFILVKNEGKWEIVVFHNMMLPNMPTGPPAQPPPQE